MNIHRHILQFDLEERGNIQVTDDEENHKQSVDAAVPNQQGV